MNSDEKALMRILFINRMLQSSGQEFEDLFTRVMQASNPQFRQIKPQGQIGDRKNDGYDHTTGSYYQAFAPEKPSASESVAVGKLKDDFAGLKKHWESVCPIKEFRFVFNDKYNGSFPTLESDLAELKAKHFLKECCTFLAKDLEDVFFKLPDDKMMAILGFLPDPSRIQMVDFGILGQVITEILRHKLVLDFDQLLSAPEMDEKIQFNGLGPQVGTLLRKGSFHVGFIDNYFRLNSNFAKQEVRNHLNDIYRRCRDTIKRVPDGLRVADVVFMEVLREITPKPTSGELQDAALTVMAYFFEACDIFEDPSTGNT
jgi:hypothetical protein